ncbi:hypothetical protein [Jiangella alba]|uniref:Uncharacterized protein n=1 Tax=Jiangella alba TaxID=561176 RepID=A0A1H5MMJ9_9ACTN|nr:hypothetical protein [Jiangella alba]SEE90350.1 hypothetical protein SAMN04488561_3271 [Jiangella alba]
MCAWSAFLAALPTAVWRILPGLGLPLGTPGEWRAEQHLPGAGTWYVLGLSAVQLVAATCCLALAIDVRRLVPRWAPAWGRRRAAQIAGGAGLAGAALLGVVVAMSIMAWDKVDPFAGQDHDAWARLCLGCYLSAALWPVLLIPAAIGYLVVRGRLDGAMRHTPGRQVEVVARPPRPPKRPRDDAL